MATVSKGRVFVSGETVTPAKLNELVDNATVSGIVNADIDASAAIALSKLATGALPTAITVASANLVDGTIVNADINASAAIAGSKLADAGITAAKLNGAQTGSAPIYGCRAWVNFDGTTVTNVDGENRCTINSSGNVSKVVRTSTGLFVVHFTTAMASTSYAVVCGSTSNDSADDSLRENESVAKTTTSVALRATRNSAASDGASNPVSGSVIIFA